MRSRSSEGAVRARGKLNSRVLQRNAEAVQIVELDDPGVLQDVDTREDWQQLPPH